MSPKTVVEVWKGEWEKEIAMLTLLDYQVILSACWDISNVSIDWIAFYKCDPQKFFGKVDYKHSIKKFIEIFFINEKLK